MIDLKQLRYFTVCTDVGSFSQAAKILYTTQSNVSKTIKTLELSVGTPLFVRLPKGLLLTAKGKHVYRYACKILEEVGNLEDFTTSRDRESLHISSNPSSWFANRFVEFYNLHYEENIHCQVYTTSVKEIMNRVQDGRDDMGFIYLMGPQSPVFDYELGKQKLEFVPLAKVDTMLYLGARHPLYGKKEMTSEELRSLRFIQNSQDEMMEKNDWIIRDKSNQDFTKMEISVTTNSDYIMERMLVDGALANLSGSYLPQEDSQNRHFGLPLGKEGGQGIFGYLKRQEEPLGKMEQLFLEYIKDSLPEKQ